MGGQTTTTEGTTTKGPTSTTAGPTPRTAGPTTTTAGPTTTTAGPTTTTAAQEPTTTAEAQEGSSSYPPLVPCPMECPAESGYFEVEPCNAFYCSCTNGIGYLQECQEGLVFHPDEDEFGNGVCDWPYNDPDCAKY